MHQGPGAVLDWKDGSRNHIMAVVGSAEDYDELQAVESTAPRRGDGHVRQREPRLVTVRLAARPRRHGATPLDASDGGRPRWTCAFVNNMPDGAFDATERQFLDLLDDGSGTDVIEVRRYTMDGVPRGERTAARIAEEYSSRRRASTATRPTC